MTVAIALAAAALWGAGDFMGGVATRRAPLLPVLLLSQALGLAGLLVAGALLGGHATGADLAAGAIAGLAGGAGVAMLYRGLAVGVMALVAPVTAVVAAVVPVATGFALGERPAAGAIAGIGLALLAVALLSGGEPVAGKPIRGVALLLAFGAGAAFAGFYIALARTSAAAGIWPLVAARGASVSVFALVAAARRTVPRVRRPALPVVAGAGVFDVTANVLYLVAVHRGLLSIVAVLVSLYPADTVLCALAVLGERLHRSQVAGVVAALGAVALIAAG